MTTAVGAEPIERDWREPPRLAAASLAFVRRKPLGAIGIALVLVLTLVALFAPVIARHDPFRFNTSDTLRSPGASYLFGTDEKGRDVFSRVAYGARISLKVGLVASGVGVTFGLIVGLVSGYIGGKLDFFLQRVVDSFQAFPALFLALAIT